MSAEGSLRAFRVVAAAAALGVLLVLGIAPALAQTSTTSYVGTTTTSPCPLQSVDLGTINVGQTSSGTVGGFASGSTGNLSQNGGSTFGTATADANGCITVTVTPTLSGSALGVRVFAVQGLRLAATGSTVTINGITGLTANPPGQQNTISITGTAPGGAAVTRSVLYKVNGAGVAGNGLSRTGAMILRWTIVGLVLIALGVGVLLLNRRRHATAS